MITFFHDFFDKFSKTNRQLATDSGSASRKKQTDNHLFINKIKSYQQVKSFPKYSFGE